MSPFSSVLRGAAAVLSLGASALWAAFFIEHLAWFTTGNPPPPRVWLAQFAHLLVAVGLIAVIWRRAVGVALTAAALMSFFALAGWPRATWLVVLTLAPLALFALADAMRRPPAHSSATC
jgi:hypothetical protein